MELLETKFEDTEKEPKKEKKIFSNLDLTIDGHTKTNFNIKVIGIGGAGCNVINYITSYRPNVANACTLYAFNTDIGPFNLMNKVENLFILNKEELKGYGSGGKPEVGAAAVIHDKEIIKQELANTDILFIVAGLGKGTGSGGAPELAKIAKELNILTVAIVNMPSIASEGNKIYNNAFNSLQALASIADSVTTISNEKIISNRNDISFFEAYSSANGQISMIIEQIINIVFKPTPINIDFADLRSFFTRNKFFLATTLKLSASNVSEEEINHSINTSITNNICDVNIENAKDAIANLVLSKRTNTNIVSNIKSALTYVTGNNFINLVSGIDYHDQEAILLTILVSGDSFLPEFKLKTEPILKDNPKVEEQPVDENYDALLKDVEQASSPTKDIEFLEEEKRNENN